VQLRAPFRLRFSVPPLRLTLDALCCAPLTLVNTVRITQTIHGRSYVIEVRPVAADRWRAQIVRAPGAGSSLMPFYGPTPDDAAHSLAKWLDRAQGPRKSES
jgi:hypothetical protein